MSQQGKRAKAKSLLDANAAASVLQEGSLEISSTPAETDTFEASFEEEIYRYVGSWLEDNDKDSAKPFAFVLCRSIQQAKETLTKSCVTNLKRYHGFCSQKSNDIRGCILFVTANLQDALAVTGSPNSTSQDLIDLIEAYGFSDGAFAIFEPKPQNLMLMRRGLSGEARKQKILLPSLVKPWSIEELEQELSQFHEDQTRTPTAVLEPWSDAKKGLTGEKLEVRISKALAQQLALRWRRGSVLAETGCPSGRMDVFITREVLADNKAPCVIEVKVLRSCYRRLVASKYRSISDAQVHLWAKKGAVQAQLYKKDIAAPTAYLCSFDARNKDVSLPEIDKYATDRGVKHMRYFMYRSSDALQSSVGGK